MTTKGEEHRSPHNTFRPLISRSESNREPTRLDIVVVIAASRWWALLSLSLYAKRKKNFFWFFLSTLFLEIVTIISILYFSFLLSSNNPQPNSSKAKRKKWKELEKKAFGRDWWPLWRTRRPENRYWRTWETLACSLDPSTSCGHSSRCWSSKSRTERISRSLLYNNSSRFLPCCKNVRSKSSKWHNGSRTRRGFSKDLRNTLIQTEHLMITERIVTTTNINVKFSTWHKQSISTTVISSIKADIGK